MAVEVEVAETTEQRLVGLREATTWDGIPPVIARLYGEVYSLLAAAGLSQAGGQLGENVVRYEGSPGGPLLDVAVELRVDIAVPAGLVASSLPATTVARALHVGPYAELGRTHQAVQAFVHAGPYEPTGLSWERYGDWDDDESKLETRCCYEVRLPSP